jgi:hypothetical protein
VTHRGQAKILDFGWAKLVPESTSPKASLPAYAATEEMLTSPGTASGAVAYMSYSAFPSMEKFRHLCHASSTDLPAPASVGAIAGLQAPGNFQMRKAFFPKSNSPILGRVEVKH